MQPRCNGIATPASPTIANPTLDIVTCDLRMTRNNLVGQNLSLAKSIGGQSSAGHLARHHWHAAQCAEPRPSAGGIDAFHEFGPVRHILNKPVNRMHGDQFVRVSAAERADYVTVKLGMLEAR